MKPDVLTDWVTTKKNLMTNTKYDSASIANFIKLRRKLIYECNGVGLLLGSDAPQVFDVPGFSLQHELNPDLSLGNVCDFKFFTKSVFRIIEVIIFSY